MLGNDRSGKFVAVGAPKDVACVGASYTGQYLKAILSRQGERKATAAE
jgi:excinuclease UvrABC ATPase subunit